MGHADVTTTMQYLHYAPRERDADLVAAAFRASELGRSRARNLDAAATDWATGASGP